MLVVEETTANVVADMPTPKLERRSAVLLIVTAAEPPATLLEIFAAMHSKSDII